MNCMIINIDAYWTGDDTAEQDPIGDAIEHLSTKYDRDDIRSWHNAGPYNVDWTDEIWKMENAIS